MDRACLSASPRRRHEIATSLRWPSRNGTAGGGLHPALSWLGGTGFREQFEREWLYGAFIAACLRSTGSFSGYIIIQQVLGLLGGGLHVADVENLDGSVAPPIFLEIASVVIGLLTVALIFSVRSPSRSSSRFGRRESWPSLRFSSSSASPAIADFVGTNPKPLPRPLWSLGAAPRLCPLCAQAQLAPGRRRRRPCRSLLASLADRSAQPSTADADRSACSSSCSR